MAPLTWRNVEAPNFGGASQMLSSAARMFENAGTGVGDAFRGLGEVRRRDASNAMMPTLAGVKSESEVDPAIAQVAGMKARNMSPELIQAMMGLRKDAMVYDTSRLQQEGIRARHCRDPGCVRPAAAAANSQRARNAALAKMTPGLLRQAEQSIVNANPEFFGDKPGAPTLGEQMGGRTDLSFGVPSDAPLDAIAPSASAGDLGFAHNRPQRGQRISDILPENSGLLPADVLGFYDDDIDRFEVLQDQYNESNTLEQELVETQYDFGEKILQDNARKAKRALDTEANVYMTEQLITPGGSLYGETDREEIRKKIMADTSVPVQTRNARIEALDRVLGQFPEHLNPDTRSLQLDPHIQSIVNEVTTSNKTAVATSPALRAAKGNADLPSAPTDENGNRLSVAKWSQKIAESIGPEMNSFTSGSYTGGLAGWVNDYAEKTQVDKGLIMAAIEDSVSTGLGRSMVLNADNLETILQPLFDPEIRAASAAELAIRDRASQSVDILASEMMEVDQRLFLLRNERGLPDTHPAVVELTQRRDALESQAVAVREQFEEQLSDYEVARRSRQSLVPEATVDPTPEELAAKRERVDRVLSGAVAGAQPVIERASDAVTGANSAIAQTVQSMTSDPLGTAQSAGESIVQAHLDVMNQAYDAITGGPVARDMEQTARQLEKSVPRNYFRNFRSPQENADAGLSRAILPGSCPLGSFGSGGEPR